jgi:LysM repeat protein
MLTALIALPVLAASVFLATPGAQAGADSGEVEVYTVLAGESLWDIAEYLAPESDPRVVIDRLRSTNQLETTAVLPGQQLIVPSGF